MRIANRFPQCVVIFVLLSHFAHGYIYGTSVLNAMFGEKGFEYIKFSPIVSLQAFDGSIKLFFY